MINLHMAWWLVYSPCFSVFGGAPGALHPAAVGAIVGPAPGHNGTPAAEGSEGASGAADHLDVQQLSFDTAALEGLETYPARVSSEAVSIRLSTDYRNGNGRMIHNNYQFDHPFLRFSAKHQSVIRLGNIANNQ